MNVNAIMITFQPKNCDDGNLVVERLEKGVKISIKKDCCWYSKFLTHSDVEKLKVFLNASSSS